MDVKVFVPTSYEPLIEGIRFQNIDAAYMDSGPAWLLHKLTDSEVILAELKDGKQYYYGEIFVRNDSSITSFEEIIGKRIAFTSWTGSSGFVFPVGKLIQEGLLIVEGDDFADLEKALRNNFENYHVGGGYKQALTLLVEGKVDVAGGAHDAPEIYLDEIEQKKIKTLIRLGKVPSHPIVIGKHVEAEVKEKFINAMLELNKPENIHILNDLYGVDGLVQTNTQEHLGDFGPSFEALRGLNNQ